MTEVFLERTFDEPVTEEIFATMLAAGEGCARIYRVEWVRSFFSRDRRRLVCCFRAPDAEAVRNMLRQVGSEGSVWSGTTHDPPDRAAPPLESANVLVERRWPDPVTIDEIQALEDAGAWCLETHRVEFVRTFFSQDRRRMICLYRAPDAEAVRMAQRMAGMPVERVWSFTSKQP